MDTMKILIEKFPQQLEAALQLNKDITIVCKQPITHICISGLGGSGIGASIVQEYIAPSIHIPCTVNKDYHIPKSVQETTLFIACSYSGNTEETISALQYAQKAKATIVIVTSGGKLQQIAEKNKYPLFLIPSGMPPRTCMGYSIVQLLHILAKTKIISTGYKNAIVKAVDLLHVHNKNIHALAKKIAKKIAHHKIAIYTPSGMEGIAIRFQQQLHENSKCIAWHNVVPEMTHNEILAWKEKEKDIAVIQFTYDALFVKTQQRIQFLKNIITKYTSNYTTLNAIGESYWERVFYTNNVCDWISYYLALELEHDAIDIQVINTLKKKMKE